MPATALLRLFVNKESKTLQVSDRNGAAFVLPYFNKYETVPLAVTIVEADLNSAGLDRFSRVDVSPLSLLIAIHSGFDTATPLTQQMIWVKDEVDNVFSGELPLNVAALNSFVGNNETVGAFLEIEWSEGTARTKAVFPITISNSITQPGSAGPSPATEYFTKNETSSQFMPKVGPAGGQQTYTSPNGLYQRIIGVDDGGLAIDQVVPV